MSWFAIQFARAAYCDRSVLKSWSCNLCTPGFDIYWVSEDNNQDSQAFVGYSVANGIIVVSFRCASDAGGALAGSERSQCAVRGCTGLAPVTSVDHQ